MMLDLSKLLMKSKAVFGTGPLFLFVSPNTDANSELGWSDILALPYFLANTSKTEKLTQESPLTKSRQSEHQTSRAFEPVST